LGNCARNAQSYVAAANLTTEDLDLTTICPTRGCVDSSCGHHGTWAATSPIGRTAKLHRVDPDALLELDGLTPSGTEGYRTGPNHPWRGSEHRRRRLSSKTMEDQGPAPVSILIRRGAVDVTAFWLGGYNFQWAWSSAIGGCAAHIANEITSSKWP